jgi:AraC-like DNA-binding protein
LGYGDPAHFTRAFSRSTGLAPRLVAALAETDNWPGRISRVPRIFGDFARFICAGIDLPGGRLIG